MKRIIISIILSVIILPQFCFRVSGQERNVGLDVYSSYVWRGTKFGSGPAFQPYLEMGVGNFSIGAWGSYSASTDESAEADIYASYEIGMGDDATVLLTVTDYYFPGTNWLDGNSHFIEPQIAIGFGGFSVVSAFMMQRGAGDLYVEAGYSAGAVDFFVGGGDGIYTDGGEFNLCNIGIGTSKEIMITDTFSIPVSGAAILNPSSEQFHVVVGISF